MNQGPGDQVPRGIEELLKRAATDDEFRKFFLAERAGVAHRIGLTLGATESAMLNGIPEEQLTAMIEKVRSAPQRSRQTLEPTTMGIRPNRPGMSSRGTRPDRPWWRRFFGQ